MKTYTTEQVWRLLKKHPTWTFEAPETNGWFRMRAHSKSGAREITWQGDNFVHRVANDNTMRFIGISPRRDWVRTNKPKPVLLDKVRGAVRIGTWREFPGTLETDMLSGVAVDRSKTYKVYLVECD